MGDPALRAPVTGELGDRRPRRSPPARRLVREDARRGLRRPESAPRPAARSSRRSRALTFPRAAATGTHSTFESRRCPARPRPELDVERLAADGRALNAERRIDRDAVFRLKMTALEALWARAANGDPGLSAYRAREGPGLSEFAIFCALAERHRSGWRRWPAEHRHPGVACRRALRRRAGRAGRVPCLAPVAHGRAARPRRTRAPPGDRPRHRLRR